MTEEEDANWKGDPEDEAEETELESLQWALNGIRGILEDAKCEEGIKIKRISDVLNAAGY